MKRIYAILFVLTLIGSLLAGCGTAPEDTAKNDAVTGSDDPDGGITPTEAADEKIFLGFAAPLTSGEYWLNFSESVVAACEEKGVRCEVQSAEVDAVKQVEIINNFITAGVDYLMVDPIDPDAVVDALVAAREAGVYVIISGSVPASEDAYDVALVASQQEVGNETAKATAEWIDNTFPEAAEGNVEVAVISTRMRPVDSERTDGFLKVAEYTTKATVIGEYNPPSDNSAAGVQEITDNIIQQYPNVKCFICYGDWPVIADEALQRSTLDTSEIGLFGNDITEGLVNGILDASSCIKGTVVSGNDVFELVAKIASGELKAEDKTYPLNVEIVTADNVDDYK